MTDVYSEIKRLNKPVVLYGTGNGADKLIDKLNAEKITVSGIFASGGFVRDRYFRQIKVTSFEDCLQRFSDMTVLMCFGSQRAEVRENVKKISEKCRLLYPEMPVYGDNIFDTAFYNGNKDAFLAAYNCLSDDISRKVFLGIVNFRLSGELKYLFECECNSAPVEFCKMQNDVHYFDLGAYNGDTVTKFIQQNPFYAEIIAVEPDKTNFKKLCNNTRDIKNIRCINAAAGNVNGKAGFLAATGRGGHLCTFAKETDCVTVDFLTQNLPSLSDVCIKADVEGSELEVIEGAKKTIKEHNTFIRISCYHRSEDLFTLLLAIKKIMPSYKVYMRHFPSIPSWDTEYFFVPN